jgi:hypothetical protein
LWGRGGALGAGVGAENCTALSLVRALSIAARFERDLVGLQDERMFFLYFFSEIGCFFIDVTAQVRGCGLWTATRMVLSLVHSPSITASFTCALAFCDRGGSLGAGERKNVTFQSL